LGQNDSLLGGVLLCRMEKGEAEMSVGCDAALGVVLPLRGEVEVVLERGTRPASPALVREKEERAGWAGWVETLIKPVGLLGQLGQELKKFLSK
jgi:hypothetical protein